MKESDLEEVLGTVHTVLLAEGFEEAAELIANNPARTEQTGYDGWNGGTEIWEVQFQIPAVEYARLGARKGQIEEQITARLKSVLESDTSDWYSAKIQIARNIKKDWRTASAALPKQIRQNIIDGMRLNNLAWFGVLNEVEFLSRLYDLQHLPSNDSRYKDAAGDIWQHCVNNDDWERDWIFFDERFGLIDGSAERFLRFLCELAHPVVRSDRDEAIKLVAEFNSQLRQAGWTIFAEEHIAGRPRFTYRQSTQQDSRTVMRARNVADALEAGWMEKEIERLENSIERDPALAIGTAKELIETCCKTLLTKKNVPFTKSEDLSDLTKKVAKELRLVPEGITDETKGAENIRLILRNLTQLTNNLAQLRGLYGTGHGREGQHRGLQPRHARLAVASAVAFIDFVADTHRAREAVETAPSKHQASE